jgi:RNA polymerase sigma factor (sigma-70 family)
VLGLEPYRRRGCIRVAIVMDHAREAPEARASQSDGAARLYACERGRICVWVALVDGQTLIELYDAHARELLGFFARRTRDPQLALDLLGDTFLTAYEQRRSCRASSDRERSAWLFRIGVNKLTDHYRRRASERRATERFAGELRAMSNSEIATVRRLAESSEPSERLLLAFDGLSDEQRDALQLRVIEEHPYPRVSRELGISEPAARARVSRGLRTLRRAMGGEREDER